MSIYLIDLFEVDMLSDVNFANEICSKIVQAIMTGKLSELKLHKLGHVLIPKKSLSDYRKCALTEVYDEIVFLTLALIVANEIERLRINKSKQRVFSYRFMPQDNGRLLMQNTIIRLFEMKYYVKVN